MEKQNRLTRHCNACGIEKPLSAFLQVSGAQGTSYGDICSTCRSLPPKEKPASIEEEPDNTDSGFRIGGKERVRVEKEQVRQFKDTKEKQTQDTKRREKITLTKFEEQDTKGKTEKEHRETYLDRKRDYLDYKTKKPIVSQQSIIQRKIVEGNITTQTTERQQVIEAKKVQDAIREEIKLTTVDFTAPLQTGQAGEVRFHNPIFQNFKNWLGSSAPISKAMDQLNQKNLGKENATEKKLDQKDPIIDYIEKTWSSTSRKR